MYSSAKVSFKEAMELIQHAVGEAERINRHIAIAVTGPEGELISFLRMDGANAASATIAQNKAYTSSRDNKETGELGKGMREGGRPPAFWGDLRITGFGGGVPIYHEDKVIGGIGISGLPEAEDERIAKASIKAVFGQAK